MKHLLNSIFILITIILVGCEPKGYFSKKLVSVVEPQTDDERTLVSEYKDYILLVDSLSYIWSGTDTLAMRRLYYKQREQKDRVKKVEKYQNIRSSMSEVIHSNLELVTNEINERFSSELRSELYSFYEMFDLKNNYSSWAYTNPNDIIDGKIYTNTYGENYFLKKSNYGIIKQPILKDDIQLFINFCKRHHIRSNTREDYVVGDGSSTRYVSDAEYKHLESVQQEIETDWDATEIDWCEECANKNYSCCPKCKNEEQEDCNCGCKGCHEMYEYHNI